MYAQLQILVDIQTYLRFSHYLIIIIKKFKNKIIGVEENHDKAIQFQRKGINCVHGDATDYEFWAQTNLVNRKIVFASRQMLLH